MCAIVAGLAALGALVVAERRSPQPMVPGALFGNRRFLAVNLVTFALDAPVPAGETITGYVLTSPSLLVYSDLVGNPDFAVTKHLYLDSMVLLPSGCVRPRVRRNVSVCRSPPAF